MGSTQQQTDTFIFGILDELHAKLHKMPIIAEMKRAGCRAGIACLVSLREKWATSKGIEGDIKIGGSTRAKQRAKSQTEKDRFDAIKPDFTLAQKHEEGHRPRVKSVEPVEALTPSQRAVQDYYAASRRTARRSGLSRAKVKRG